MKEDIAKNLIQKSTISTSDDFTDRLLLKIEAERATQPISIVQHPQMFRYAIIGILGVGLFFFISMHLGFVPQLTLFNVHLKMSKTPLTIITTLLFLLGTNHILKIQHLSNVERKKQD